MGNIDSRGDLAIAEIAFYAPAFVVGVAINFKQGFTGGVGWIYLVTLSILRLIGASCTLYMESQNDYSQSLEETAFITSAIGKSQNGQPISSPWRLRCSSTDCMVLAASEGVSLVGSIWASADRISHLDIYDPQWPMTACLAVHRLASLQCQVIL